MSNAAPEARAAAVKEVELLSSGLMALSRALDASCRDENKNLLLCKSKDNRSGACLQEGREVTACAVKIVDQIEKSCPGQFQAYQQCFEKNNYRYERCRLPQAAFEECYKPHAKHPFLPNPDV